MHAVRSAITATAELLVNSGSKAHKTTGKSNYIKNTNIKTQTDRQKIHSRKLHNYTTKLHKSIKQRTERADANA